MVINDQEKDARVVAIIDELHEANTRLIARNGALVKEVQSAKTVVLEVIEQLSATVGKSHAERSASELSAIHMLVCLILIRPSDADDLPF